MDSRAADVEARDHAQHPYRPVVPLHRRDASRVAGRPAGASRTDPLQTGTRHPGGGRRRCRSTDRQQFARRLPHTAGADRATRYPCAFETRRRAHPEGFHSTDIRNRLRAGAPVNASIEAGAFERSSSTVVIRPTSGPIPPRLKELWAYRELFLILVGRDMEVRHAQTKLGFAWMIFQPLALLLVYTFAFSHLARVTIPGNPLPGVRPGRSDALDLRVARGVHRLGESRGQYHDRH